MCVCQSTDLGSWYCEHMCFPCLKTGADKKQPEKGDKANAFVVLILHQCPIPWLKGIYL